MTAILERRESESLWGRFCNWITSTEKENLKNDFLSRIKALDKEWYVENILEKTTQFCNNETKKEYLPKIDDPFLHGVSRGRIKKLPHLQIRTKTYNYNHIGGFWINKRGSWINKNFFFGSRFM